MKKTIEERFEPVADLVEEKTENIFGSKAFDRVCIASGLIGLGWFVAWLHFIGQRG